MATIPYYPSLAIGMEFDDLTAAKEIITDAVIQARESFKVKNAEARFWAVECYKKTQLACGFKVSLSLSLSTFANKLDTSCLHRRQSQTHITPTTFSYLPYINTQ
jgi:hypothetical protein